MQLSLADFMDEQYQRKQWIPPKRELLRLRDADAVVRPIYSKGDLAGREMALTFLREHHYLHQAPGSKAPNFTWGFGLFLRGQLAGTAMLNPPAAGVPTRYFGQDSPLRAGMIAVTRTCCSPAAPFNSESMLVSAALRMLPHLDHRFHTVIAQSDLSVVDPENRTHCGILYMGCNAFWAGYSNAGQWRGFFDPTSGARISRKVGARERRVDECPEGWVVEPAATLSNFLWFIGRGAPEARQHLLPSVQVLVRQGVFPVWRHPVDIKPGTPRAYSERDKALRAAEISA